MALLNFATKELTLKIVYYGPGLSGKTTNLQSLHKLLNHKNRGNLVSIATETDRTLYFDFLPVSLGKINGFTIKIQLYTVPGQVYYNATRKLVLKGADAVVFVANSQKSFKAQNIESLQNMYENLIANNINPNDIPILLQYNKRDLPGIDTVEELNGYLNQKNYPYAEGIAVTGVGVKQSLQIIIKQLMQAVNEKYGKSGGFSPTPIRPQQKTQVESTPKTPKDMSVDMPEENRPIAPVRDLRESSISDSEFDEEEKEKNFFQKIFVYIRSILLKKITF